jgi:heat shock protein HspQ
MEKMRSAKFKVGQVVKHRAFLTAVANKPIDITINYTKSHKTMIWQRSWQHRAKFERESQKRSGEPAMSPTRRHLPQRTNHGGERAS